eukprot:jgi/Ulvmu1/3105/UM015_0145.1
MPDANAIAHLAHAPSHPRTLVHRRLACQASFALCVSQFLSRPLEATAAEADECATCLGAVDGTLGSCAGIDGCISSFDDRPKHFVNPWEFDGARAGKLEALASAIDSYNGNVTEQDGLYLRAEFKAWGGNTDVYEFLLEGDDNVVELRGVAGGGLFPQSRLRTQFEQIRAALRWDEVYILRNRKRFFGVLESPLDTFGDEAPLGDAIDRLITE